MEDLDWVSRMNSDPRVMQYIGPVETRELTVKKLEKIIKRSSEGDGLGVWALFRHADSENPIGNIALKELPGRTEIEAGYRLFPEFWGQGFATEALGALLRYGFETVGLDRIVAITHRDNLASQRVILKNGFTFLGRTWSYDMWDEYFELKAGHFLQRGIK